MEEQCEKGTANHERPSEAIGFSDRAVPSGLTLFFIYLSFSISMTNKEIFKAYFSMTTTFLNVFMRMSAFYLQF